MQRQLAVSKPPVLEQARPVSYRSYTCCLAAFHARPPPQVQPLRPTAVVVGPLLVDDAVTSVVLNGSDSICPSGACSTYDWRVACPGLRAWVRSFATPTTSLPIGASSGIPTVNQAATRVCTVSLTVKDPTMPGASAAATTELTVRALGHAC